MEHADWPQYDCRRAQTWFRICLCLGVQISYDFFGRPFAFGGSFYLFCVFFPFSHFVFFVHSISLFLSVLGWIFAGCSQSLSIFAAFSMHLFSCAFLILVASPLNFERVSDVVLVSEFLVQELLTMLPCFSILALWKLKWGSGPVGTPNFLVLGCLVVVVVMVMVVFSFIWFSLSLFSCCCYMLLSSSIPFFQKATA